MQIDFVIPWVDSSDKAWQKKRARYALDDDRDANAEARFRDMDTLRYVLRSIEQNAPWYNRIFLITERHLPKWLDASHPKIVHITHKELFYDPSHLPVFNSVAIEMNLPNLSDLSEHFVYMNDDFFIVRPVEKSRFFVDGKPVDFLAHRALPRNALFGLFRRRDTWVHSINNTLRLLNDRFAPLSWSDKKLLYDGSYSLIDKTNNLFLEHFLKRFLWLQHWHLPQPLCKRTLLEVKEHFFEEMMETSRHRFRSKDDLNQYIYRYYHLLRGEFHPKKYNDGIVRNLDSIGTLDEMIKIIRADPLIKFACFNDSVDLGDREFVSVKRRIGKFLEQTFPKKASFEH